ncbi:MAG: class I SAM-dependent methyltransferase [Candidatus Latescibacterota bacterium]
MASRTCPVWVGYLLASPLRRLLENPERELEPYVLPGMRVLDVGSAMGFFSLPMARMVGPSGCVICVDVQERMLQVLERRGRRAQLAERLRLRPCRPDTLGLEDLAGTVDFALAVAVVHEVPDASRFLSEIAAALRPQAHLLLAEPRGHVGRARFEETVELARQAGLTPEGTPKVARSRSALLRR